MSRAAGLIALALLCAGAADAQTQVYRCGVEGRSYSLEPCEGGRPVDVADPRSAQQATQTRQAALRDAREADALARARLHAERVAARQGPAQIGSSKVGQPDDARCANRAQCAHGESKRRHDKSHTVTLYRAADTR